MRPEASINAGVYTGVGSRYPTPEGFELGRQVAFYLARAGLSLRSGGAIGMDTAWAVGAEQAQRKPSDIMLPRRVPDWAYCEVRNYLDPGPSLEVMAPSIRALLARNMQQVLGRDGTQKSVFLLYWAPVLDGTHKSAGGTRYAVRCAVAHGVPTLNILESDLSTILAWASEHLP